MAVPLVTNIGSGGRRRRYVIGAVALGVGLAATVALVAFGVARGARLLVFVPFFLGMLGLLQARGGT
jgi:hypothetical protein